MTQLDDEFNAELRLVAARIERLRQALREAAEALDAAGTYLPYGPQRTQAENAAESPALRRRAEEALVQLYLLTRDSRGEAA